MREPRYTFASVLVGQQLFAVGGEDGDNLLKTVEVLDLGQPRAWESSKVSLPTATHYLKATLLNNRIVVVGGVTEGFLSAGKTHSVYKKAMILAGIQDSISGGGQLIHNTKSMTASIIIPDPIWRGLVAMFACIRAF